MFGFLIGQPQQRILLVLYGQSNMGGLTSQSISPPAADPNTKWYDGAQITSVPNANGIRELMNALASATGKTILALSGAVAGASLSGLVKGSSGYTALMAQISAVILPTDSVAILWDQGEGDANASPHPDEITYKALIGQLHADLTSDMGLTKAQCPFIMSSLGTSSITPGDLNTGTTDASWQTIKSAIYNCSLEQTYNHFSHSNMDAVRNAGDVYHYDGTSQGRQGKRFAQTLKSIWGYASGEAHWHITGGSTVDATHTNLTLQHSAGTDFTPASGATGFEVSGNNGATWSAATGARLSATSIQLTHASLSTTSTRIVRHQWGLLPPDASGVNPSTNPVLDNSAVNAPLSYTTWNIRPTPISNLPVPTWRYNLTSTGSGQVQTASGLPLGPAISAQKLCIFSFAGAGLDGVLTVTPNVGSPITAALVKRQGHVQIQQALLGADANTASTVDLSIDFGVNPFTGNIVQLWTVPVADLNSTTALVGGASTTSALAATATVNVSAGGFIIEVAKTNQTAYSTPVVVSGSETYAGRYENPSPFCTQSADASNCSANSASSVTATFSVSGNIDLALAAWR